MVMFKILVKSLKNPFWIFRAFEIFTKEIFSKNSKKILSCHIWHAWWSWQLSCHGEQYNPMKASQNHFCPFSSLNIFALSNMSKCSQTRCTCSNGVIICPRPNGTSWRECCLDQSTPKPFLSRTKFEQLYIAKCVLLIWIFVDMFKSSNDDTTPSGASRRIDLHD